MTYTLPTTVEINSHEYAVRSDFRAILDILEAVNDVELDDQERAAVMLGVFYPDFESMPTSDYEGAIAKCLWFISCGQLEDKSKKHPKLVDWQQDFPVIVAPVNRVMGKEVRLMDYLHWWTFIGAYQEIGGNCLFAQIVGIRQKLANGKALDKSEKEFYRSNRNLVDLKQQYTEWENGLIREWI